MTTCPKCDGNGWFYGMVLSDDGAVKRFYPKERRTCDYPGCHDGQLDKIADDTWIERHMRGFPDMTDDVKLWGKAEPPRSDRDRIDIAVLSLHICDLGTRVTELCNMMHDFLSSQEKTTKKVINDFLNAPLDGDYRHHD